MCVAVSGRVVSIHDNTAEVDISGNKMTVQIGVVFPKVGDYVLVHAGYAVEIVSMEVSDEIEELYKELGEAYDELHP